MKKITVSIIIPVYNAETFLPETVDSIRAQSFSDFEVILVDGGSQDASVEILREAAEKDSRFHILQGENLVGGAAKNRGFAEAKGEYVLFAGCQDLMLPQLLEKLVKAASAAEADITACNFNRFRGKGKGSQGVAVQSAWLPEGKTVFCYRDCPDYILQILNPEAGNKLYNSTFLREKLLKFEEISSDEDISFTAVTAAAAEKITYIPDSLVRFRLDGSMGIGNVVDTVCSAEKQVGALPYSDQLHNAIVSFTVKTLVTALAQRIKSFSAPEAAQLYETVHQIFTREDYRDVTPQTLHNHHLYREFCTVRKHDYQTMKRMQDRRLIVSLTTYPKRIATIGRVLESIYSQTRKADEVVLWLAEEQFPEKEGNLPEDLLKLSEEKRLTIRWCNDLKPHKKYFYALQEYTDDLVVTVDDDLLYSANMLDSLYRSYLLYPEAVSTVRAHLILISEEQKILPYKTWIQETDTCIYEPNMQLLATGGAGVLYPPKLFKKEFFDQKVIMELCPWADDLWLKVMQVMSDVPVVLARPFEPLQYLEGSQEEALYQLNVRQNYNDVQLAKVSAWLDEKYEPGILVQKLSAPYNGKTILGIELVCGHLDQERKAIRKNLIKTTEKLRQTEQALHQTEQTLHQTEQMLRQTEQNLKLIEESEAPVHRVPSFSKQYRELGIYLRKQKDTGGASVSWYVKYIIYLLGWIPGKLLTFMISLVRNGFSDTIRRIIKKIAGR